MRYQPVSSAALFKRVRPRRHAARRLQAATVAAAIGIAGLGLAAAGHASGLALRVVGNHLVDSSGNTLRLLGVNRSGSEYMCPGGGGVFDGPTDAASVAAIASWHANTVRVPLNEDCWLGINGMPSGSTAAAYQAAIHGFVTTLHAGGMYVVLDLHWNAPGTLVARGQKVMADADHAPALWQSVATSFRSDPAVLFDLYNEPHLSSADTGPVDPWTCWRDGCTASPSDGITGTWQTAGMQSLVTAVRSTGATQPILVGGLGWSSDLSGWTSHIPTDPANALVASFHVYNFSGCSSSACWASTVGAVAAAHPVVTGELGENDCAHGFIDGFMNWADSAGVSYLGWSWNTTSCSGFPALISNYDGTPTNFGVGLRDRLQRIAAAPEGASPPASTPTAVTTPVPTTPAAGGGTPPAAGVHVANAYVGKGYVNPEWKAKVETVAGGSRISSNPTAVWLDRIAAIAGTTGSSSNGSMGVRQHLDAALAQRADYIQFVIYDLPGRDCAALASNGELGPTDITRYQNEYINAIYQIESDPKYAGLRIIHLTEIDSLPNLVTNTAGTPGATAGCDTMKANGNYVTGIQYALSTFHKLPNVYQYIDAAHHGWLGWPANFAAAADLFASTAKGATGGTATVDGFIVNTANYSALTEPYFTAATTVGGTQVKASKWVGFNDYVDELSYAQALRTKLVSIGFDSGIGMLIDTSRNGWGGPNRPTAPSTATVVDTFVDQSRVDRRIHAGNWCNQSGAGLGERPQANPQPGIDAYVWAKPPGESDGSSTAIANTEGKGFDRMCDPTYTGNARNGNSLTGALPNAPISGAFFPSQVSQLMANAFPALSTATPPPVTPGPPVPAPSGTPTPTPLGTPVPAPAPVPGPIPAPATGGIAVNPSCTVSAPTVAPGGHLEATGGVLNTGSSSVTLQRVVLAARPPGGTNSGGPYDDFTPGKESVTIPPGSGLLVTASRAFTTSDPSGAWYCYITYQTMDGMWHDDGTDAHFTVAASVGPGGTGAGAIVVTRSMVVQSTSFAVGAHIAGTATLTNRGGTAITLSSVVLATRPPGGSNAGGPYLDLAPEPANVVLQPGQSFTVVASRAAVAPTGAYYGYVTFRTADGAWHDDSHVVRFAINQ